MGAQSVVAGTTLPLLRLSVAQYHAMRDAGILAEEDRVELLNGLLVPKMTKKPPHSLATELTRKAVEALLPEGWHARSQEPITTDDSEPEPDLTVARGSVRDYADRHPGPADVTLVIEVADDSIRRDRRDKLAIYARAGIPSYWIVNIPDRVLEVHVEPRGDVYAQKHTFALGDEVALLVDGRDVGRIAIATLLP